MRQGRAAARPRALSQEAMHSSVCVQDCPPSHFADEQTLVKQKLKQLIVELSGDKKML